MARTRPLLSISISDSVSSTTAGANQQPRRSSIVGLKVALLKVWPFRFRSININCHTTLVVAPEQHRQQSPASTKVTPPRSQTEPGSQKLVTHSLAGIATTQSALRRQDQQQHSQQQTSYAPPNGPPSRQLPPINCRTTLVVAPEQHQQQ